MIVDLHPGIRIQKLTIGTESAPLLVIDNLIADPERLVTRAASRQFFPVGSYYPGIRVEAPLSYQHLILDRLQNLLFEHFGLQGTSFKFSMCHYSLVTTPAAKLAPLQRIPHIDSVDSSGLATVHYLFKKDLGGTAFYRHRATGFEYVDAARREEYFKHIGRITSEPGLLAAEYINGDTEQFEQIASQAGVFNRMLIYRRNSLHSACIARDFVPDPNPLTGRFSINSFIDLVP